jgi:PAS domain S-box-containing protein
MTQVFTIYSVFFLATALVSFFVSFLAWQRRSVKGAYELTLLMIAAGFGAFCLIFETAASSVSEKIFWSKLEYIGGTATPLLYLIFVLRFSGKDKYISVKNILLLLIVPAITLLLVVTNQQHNLIWSGFSSISSETNLMEYYHGIGFWIGYIAYTYVLLSWATISLFTFIIRHTMMFRAQGWIILIAGLCPWISSFIYITGNNPVAGLDLAPVSIILSGTLAAYAIFYIRFLDLVPVAREILVEILTDGIIVLDGLNRIQDINEAALSFLGVKNKNVLGKPIESAGATVNILLDAVILKESVDQIEVRDKNSIRTFSIFIRAIKNQTGSRLVAIRDITDQIENQREIFAAEERYRNMFTMFRLMADNMPDMLWAKDLDKKYIFANKSVCENFMGAKDTDEPIGKTDLFFAVREQQKFPERSDWHTFGEVCQDSDQVVINSGKTEHFDEFGNVKGKFLFLDVRKSPIVDENGKMIGVVGSARDVTNQKKSESEIYQRDILLDAIAKATGLLVQGEDLRESINGALEIIGKATKVNRVYIFQNSYKPEFSMPLMSQSYEWTDGSVQPQIDNPELQELPYETACPRWCKVLSSGGVIVGNISEFPEPEKTYLAEQGIVSILVTPIFIDKTFWGFMGFDDCLVERGWPPTQERILSAAANTIGAAYLRKKNQKELIEAKEKAEESDRLKSAFLANMSHEIRTPMNGIMGFANLLKEPDLRGETQQEYIMIIEKSGIRMLNIINDLIDISKIESGQSEIITSVCNLNELTDFIYTFFKPEVEGKSMRLIINNALPDTEAVIKTDREKIIAILTNLVKNAIKYSDKGTIEFGYKLTKPEGNNRINSNKLEFYVKDSGIGIAKDRQQAIFERFVQADINDSRAFQGAGLGLSITRAYVEMLGGRIWVESVIGKGSIFYFTVPYNVEKKIITRPKDKNPSPGADNENLYKNLKILIAEDEAASDLLITILLKGISNETLHARTGIEALEICQRNPDINLVLMDIKMPLMDGYEVTRQIRKFNKKMIIIAQTAYGLTGDREKAIAAGCNDHISKPINRDTLLKIIKTHFRNK